MLKRNAIICCLALMLACATSCQAVQPTIKIKAQRSSMSIGEQLWIDVTLTNGVDAVCIFDTFSPAAKAIAKWIVTGPDGQPIPYQGPIAKIKHGEIVRHLEPGDTVSGAVNLSGTDTSHPYFELTDPGSYRVTLIWSMVDEWSKPIYLDLFQGCRPWVGKIQSNTIVITVSS